ncbi:MAG TPA: carbohydrate ABC transporter permease [Firmicutes bacterium]|nr:carbohydrate ABC transporter permease [Bacillota bacterium]
MKTEHKFRLNLQFVIASILAVIFLFPIYWMFITSLRPEVMTTVWPPKLFPTDLTLENYKAIVSNTVETPVFRWFFNSLVAASGYTILSCIVCSLAAYALACLDFPGREVYFWALITSLIIPGIILLIPNYLLVNRLGWVDTYLALILPGLSGATGVFLMRQFFLTIPKSLQEAAWMDGAGRFWVFLKIVLPLSKPVLLTYGLMSFLANWNDYLWALIVTYAPRMRTLPVGILTLQGRYIHYYGKMMAGAFLTALPAIILFVAVQRYFVKGIVMTGMKT